MYGGFEWWSFCVWRMNNALIMLFKFSSHFPNLFAPWGLLYSLVLWVVSLCEWERRTLTKEACEEKMLTRWASSEDGSGKFKSQSLKANLGESLQQRKWCWIRENQQTVGRIYTWGMQPLVCCILLHYHNIGSYANNCLIKKLVLGCIHLK